MTEREKEKKKFQFQGFLAEQRIERRGDEIEVKRERDEGVIERERSNPDFRAYESEKLFRERESGREREFFIFYFFFIIERNSLSRIVEFESFLRNSFSLCVSLRFCEEDFGQREWKKEERDSATRG